MIRTSTYTVAPSHTYDLFNPKTFTLLCDQVVKAVEVLRRHYRIDALAGCGHSAAPLLGVVSLMTNIPMILVRKETDKSNHDPNMVNGQLTPYGKYLFLDDLIASGETFKHVVTQIVQVESMYPSVLLMYNPCFCPSSSHSSFWMPTTNAPVFRLGDYDLNALEARPVLP